MGASTLPKTVQSMWHFLKGRRAALVLLTSFVLCSAGTLTAQTAPRFVEDEESNADLVGKKAPDFTLQTLGGEKVTLSKLKGKVVLVDFWASWCGPCRKSMPHLEETWQKYKDKGLVVVGINVDKEPEKARAFLGKLSATTKISYATALDPNARVLGAYQVMQMPTAVLIGRDGLVKERIVGFSEEIGAKTTTQIEALLKAK